MRWEWRTFGDDLGGAEHRLRASAPEGVHESDETYLLSAAVHHAVKVRDGMMDIKQLVQVNRDGLELWRPVMKAPLPISPADASAVLAALDVNGSLEPSLGAYSVDDLAAAADGVRLAPVHKSRHHYTFHECLAEVSELRTARRSMRTIAIESENAEHVLLAVRELGLLSRPNLSVPRALTTVGSGPEPPTARRA